MSCRHVDRATVDNIEKGKDMLSFIKRFAREEDGLALTEYLILLGLLTAIVIAAVLIYGNNLGVQWEDWADWIGSEDLSAPDVLGGTLAFQGGTLITQ